MTQITEILPVLSSLLKSVNNLCQHHRTPSKDFDGFHLHTKESCSPSEKPPDFPYSPFQSELYSTEQNHSPGQLARKKEIHANSGNALHGPLSRLCFHNRSHSYVCLPHISTLSARMKLLHRSYTYCTSRRYFEHLRCSIQNNFHHWVCI